MLILRKWDVFTKWDVFDPNAPPREKRPLRVGPPDVFWFTSSDGARLRLTRYKGGAKGPVMLDLMCRAQYQKDLDLLCRVKRDDGAGFWEGYAKIAGITPNTRTPATPGEWREQVSMRAES